MVKEVMVKRLFTPAQANKTLPLVRRIVADILENGRELRRIANGKDNANNSRRLEELGNRIYGLIGELRQIGCEYTDWSFDKGLVDFPGMIGNELVDLCWRSDEPGVIWYHAREAGYAGRKKIPGHLLAEPVQAEQ